MDTLALTRPPVDTKDEVHMSPHRVYALGPVAASFARLAEVNGIGWLAGVVAAGASALIHDLFGFLFLLCVSASMADYHWGKRVVRHLEATNPGRVRYDPALAQLGWQSKMVGLLVLLLIRAFEWWALHHSIPDIPGLMSVLVGVAYLKHELDSMDANSQRVGKRIPGVTHILRILDSIESRLNPVPKA